MFFLGALGTLSAAFLKIDPVPESGFRWADMFSRGSQALRSGLAYGMIGLFIGLIFELDNIRHVDSLIQAITGGVTFGVVGGMIRLVTWGAIENTRSAINEGTKRSIRMGLLSSITFMIIGGLIGLVYGMSVTRSHPGDSPFEILVYHIFFGVIFGLMFGLVGGLTCGGMFALKHFVLRVFLRVNGSAPLNYDMLLAYAKKLLFLRQVGGGYIFIHRLLQEYFASLSGSNVKPKPRVH